MKQGGRGIRILWMETFMTLVVVYNLSIWLLRIKKKKGRKETWIANLTKTNDKTKSTQFALIAIEPERTAHTGCLLDLFINRSCDQKGRAWWLLQEGHRWQADTTVMTHELTMKKKKKKKGTDICVEISNPTQPKRKGGKEKEKTQETRPWTTIPRRNFQIHNVLCRKLHY